MKKFTLAVAALAVAFTFVPSPSSAAGSTPMATISQAVRAFNAGDYKTWAAACASPAQVIDDFPPHVWSGATACADWVAAFEAMIKKQKLSSMTVAFGTPTTNTVTGNVAYVVLPATLHYNANNKPVKMTGAVMTIALKKTSGGWLMTGWAWADGK
jgi:ketosteroid isomerase-like protein